MTKKKKIDVVWNPDDKQRIASHARARGWSFGMFVAYILEEHVRKKKSS